MTAQMDFADLREALKDRDAALRAAKHFAEARLADDARHEGADVTKALQPQFEIFWANAVRTFAEANMSAVHRHSESPIERVLLGSLVLSFIKNDPIGLFMTAPGVDAEAHVAAFRAAHLAALNSAAPSSSDQGAEYADWQMHRSFVAPFAWNALHAMPQAGFPDIKVGGRSCRADLFVWIPSTADSRVIVECDGYEYHRDKQAFERDRARDREFQRRGYQVLRYAGAEIHRDPIAPATALYDDLQQIRQRAAAS